MDPDRHIPIACTLTVGEMGGRVEEFRRLLAEHLAGMERPEPRWLRLVLHRPDGLEATARDLVAREQQCCAFFAFAVTAAGDRLVIDARVPAGAEPTLDGLARIAERAAALRIAERAAPGLSSS